MRYIILALLLFISSVQSIEFGTIATASKTGMYYKLGTDISKMLVNYSINLEPIVTHGSYENLSILNGKFMKNRNTFFAIVQKDAISYYNYKQYQKDGSSILSKIPAILSLGIEEIHILTREDEEFDFENRKTYKVYCGKANGGSCITAQYIERSYGFKFIYMNIKKENRLKKLKEGMVDLIISVIEAPAKSFENLEDVKLIDLPTNFAMEDMYSHSILKKSDYPWIEEDIHAFAVPKVLVTNLSDKKYDPIIENFIQILVFNKKFLEKEYGEYWSKIDFNYMKYKKFSKVSRKVIDSIK